MTTQFTLTPVPPHEERFALTPRTYRIFTYLTFPPYVVQITTQADQLVDVFFVDQPNLLQFQRGAAFRYYGARNIVGVYQTVFRAPTPSNWFLVVLSQSDLPTNVHLVSAIEHAAMFSSGSFGSGSFF